MAALHLDHNVARHVGVHLRAMGHDVTSAQREGLSRAGDDEHLLVAAEQDRVIITHNRKDFFLLHDAWRRWSAAWQVRPRHAGILVIPTWPPEEAARELNTFLQRGLPLSNKLYSWQPSQGWVLRP